MVNMNFSEQDIKFVSQEIEVLIFRNCVLAGKVANKYEVLFAKIAHGIYEKELINTEDIYKKISKILLVMKNLGIHLGFYNKISASR